MRVPVLPVSVVLLLGCASSEDAGSANPGQDAGGGEAGAGGSGSPLEGGADGDQDGELIDGSVTADATSDGTVESSGDAPISSDMVGVPSGAFQMGCNDCDADESPLHSVVLSAFEIDRLEVTQQDYQACIDASGCTSPVSGTIDLAAKALHPVTGVSWAQAAEFCSWMGKRLPSEAEWEKAARGTDARSYPWGNQAPSCSLANTSECGGQMSAVGMLPSGASPYGALDMAGNAWEWVADWYASDAYAQHNGSDPTGPASGSSRVYRGGSSGNAASLARCSNRASTYNPAVGGSGLGFRCAK